MNLRAGPVSGAVIALLAGCSLCHAAEPTRDRLRAALGGMIGGSQIVADTDYSNRREPTGEYGALDSSPRFAFSSHFRYAFNSWLRGQVGPGFFWSGYQHSSPLPFTDPNFPNDTTKEKVITLVLPISAQLQFTHHRGPWIYHVGGGPGVYRVWVENRRKVLKDNFTKRLHRGTYPGVSGQFGVERFLTALPSVAMEVSAAGHWAFADRPEQFPLGFNSAVLGVELRVGASYYFDMARFQSRKTEATPPAGK